MYDSLQRTNHALPAYHVCGGGKRVVVVSIVDLVRFSSPIANYSLGVCLGPTQGARPHAHPPLASRWRHRP